MIRSSDQSNATLWVPETCLIVGLLPSTTKVKITKRKGAEGVSLFLRWSVFLIIHRGTSFPVCWVDSRKNVILLHSNQRDR